MSARRKRWDFRPSPQPEPAQQPGLSPLLAQLLAQRGQEQPDAIRAFLEADYRSGMHDPMLMLGMAEAVARIAHAVQHAEPMAAYGDFDTDGVTAVTLLVQALTAMGGNIRPYIPHRAREGYGLNSQAVRQLADEGVRLLITVDCGISNAAEVAEAASLGLDVIVTDHHHPPAELPPALAILNPKQAGCAYPYKQLVGVGIAFKLVQALVKRGLVKAGLDAIHSSRRPGLKALIDVAGLVQSKVTSSDIGYMLAPRLNAAGRLDDAVLAYKLLLAEDQAAATIIAQELNRANRARQELTKQVQTLARERAESDSKHELPVVVLDDAAFAAGVVGLVAGKLSEEWGRPVLLIERGETESKGSARSIPGFSMIDALTACDDLFVRFGGHAAAAGFTIATENLPTLEARLIELAEGQLSDGMLQPAITIDATVGLNELGWPMLDELLRLEPFGQANQQPLLMSPGVEVVDARPRGGDGQHLRLLLRKGGATYEAIAFRLGHLADALRRRPLIDVAYTLEANEWNGERRLQLNVKDFRRAS
jgi:single-stranded-DNA-specific exonuclease